MKTAPRPLYPVDRATLKVADRAEPVLTNALVASWEAQFPVTCSRVGAPGTQFDIPIQYRAVHLEGAEFLLPVNAAVLVLLVTAVQARVLLQSNPFTEADASIL